MIRQNSPLAAELDIDAVIAGEKRLSAREALRLYHEATLPELGRWASQRAEQIHGKSYRSYVIDRNINYTNVCSAKCTFCAFRRDGDEHDAYTLNREQLHQKVQELVNIGGTQILLQGGMNPELSLPWYEQMLRGLKEAFPQVHIHGFSPPEFVEFVAVCELDGFPSVPAGQGHKIPRDRWQAKLETILQRLMEAGLDSIPGGGGEIFSEPVRRRIGMGKSSARDWLDVMSTGHRHGMHTSATMMFGHIEGIADRIDHMQRVRDRQDEAIANNYPGRYVSFISWPFQRENTPLGRLPDWDPESGEPFDADNLAEAVLFGELDGEDKAACKRFAPGAGRQLRTAGASEYLRTQAISRLFLDNIHSIGSSWVTMGPKIGQLGLYYGANDMGSVMMEENVVSAAGTTYCLTEPYICHLIREAGFVPAQRDNRYHFITTHEGDEAPDLQVHDWSTHRQTALHQEGIPQTPANGDEGGTVPLTINSMSGKAQ
jgi:cyclic dehypoxanthinyl futalosine synthase